jgi:uncharacterized SAM-binding protein YcdF (DUF218 family)
MRLDAAVAADARRLWNYHRLDLSVGKADVILGLGSYDITVAEFSTRLFQRGLATWLVFAGGLVPRTDLLRTPWNRAEAEVFGEFACAMGVPRERLLLETQSANTGENFRFAFDAMLSAGVECRSLLVVTKPNMERRARATAVVNLPNAIAVVVTSAPTSFDEYCKQVDPQTLVSLMVGDLQRIALYPQMGFQAEELIPGDVRAAYRRLVQAGYTGHLLPQTCSPELLP